MDSKTEVSIEILKGILLENTMLQVDADSITQDTILFGEHGIGLDSLDALQIIVSLEKRYGIEIKDPETAREALESLAILQSWLQKRLTSA
ncbi:MAG: phosphopantetheine-binding protein [Verrucomicrobiota bacterium]